MIKHAFSVAALYVALTTSAMADDTSIAAAFAGKQLTGSGVDMTINPNGTFTGKVGKNLSQNFSGTWKIKNGKWCRTINEPERFKGSECQKLTMNGDGTVTIEGRRGPATYTLK